jgi:threonine dehydrogenase-like Zn-dependent dehydrogenase
MKAAVLTALGTVELQERPDPQAPPGWVVVAVESASLCGTDVHQYDGRIDTPFPRVPGHGFAGRVESVGKGADPELVGLAVAVKPSLPCGECADYAAGRLADCQKKLIGLWSDGCLAERVAVPQEPGPPTGGCRGLRAPRCSSRSPSASTPSTGC